MGLDTSPGAQRTYQMSVALWMFVAMVVAPLVLLVVDLVSRKPPTPSAPPGRGAAHR